MVKKELMIVADYSRETPLSFAELCEICGVKPMVVEELIEYQVIHPAGQAHQEWVFDLDQLKRAQAALRLQHDLEINLAGVAVVLDLVERIEELNEQMAFYERHFRR